MQRYVWTATLVLILVGGIANPAEKHFVDPDGSHLREFEPHYPLLVRYFGESVPRKIMVHREARSGSIFDVENCAITLAASLQGRNLVSTGIHETAHVAMYRMTKGASLLDEFRFLDEGFVNIIQSIVDSRPELYRKRSMYIANRELDAGNVNFARVQNWTEYFGDWSSGKDDIKRNPNAYPVGASFVFYLMDTFGEAKWRKVLIDIGSTRKLETSLVKIVGKNMATVENEWRKYVVDHRDASVSAPRIVEQVPAHGAVDVDPDTRELFVRFDQEMNTHMLYVVNDGVDFGWQDAHWRDDRTLVISVKYGLTHNRRYSAALGGGEGRLLESAVGPEFPVTRWTFTTR